MFKWKNTDQRLRKANATIRRLKEAAALAERTHKQEIVLLKDRITVQEETIAAYRADTKAFMWQRNAEGMLDKGVAHSLAKQNGQPN